MLVEIFLGNQQLLADCTIPLRVGVTTGGACQRVGIKLCAGFTQQQFRAGAQQCSLFQRHMEMEAMRVLRDDTRHQCLTVYRFACFNLQQA
ncbi:hypothetical protein D3C87_1933270 [compost metagenome]